MRKVYKSLLAVLTVALLSTCIVLAGCGSVAGTYKFKSMTIGGTTIEAGQEYMGVTIDEDYASITLNKDGTITQTVEGTTVDAAGMTWEEKDGKVEIKANDIVVQTYTIEGKTLVYEIAGIKMVLSK